ncbi:MAG: penicillin-binding protein 1B [Porticoccaceae bacterium]
MARRKKSKATTKSASRGRGFLRRLALWLLFWAVVGGAIAVVVLDSIVRAKFEGAKWALPAHVYGRALDLYAGQSLSPGRLRWELDQLGYRAVASVSSPGQYRVSGAQVELYTRPFEFWDGYESAKQLSISFSGNSIQSLRGQQETLDVVRLEPMMIGGIYPDHQEDRVLVTLAELPPYLVDGLLAVEDQNFYRHFGISPTGIARALLSNIVAGSTVQGGSTITQQLVKNFYLSQERSLVRKGIEAVMAIMLEIHYSKEAILETYLNEVFLGQSGKRAIHGFGLASRHYFRQPISELEVHKAALLIGMVKGASYYDPWRNPERAKSRRNLVLDVMAQEGVISEAEAGSAKAKPLEVAVKPGTSTNPYPAYLQLVREQLSRDYREEDLKSAGLRIFTHFDPQVQHQMEASISAVVDNLEKGYRIPSGALETAAVMVRIGTADVLALAGGRKPGYAGYNRAVDARRQVGSTIKPAVYLTALERSRQYTLATLIDDAPVSVKSSNGTLWQPQNYEKHSNGMVPLFRALGNSLNQATARLGMQLGLPNVTETIRRLGYEGAMDEYPSMLLGSMQMSPMEVASIFHTIAAEGFYTPLRTISAVYTADNQPLKRYPFQTEQRFSPQVMHLLQYGLQVVMREGTGRGAYRRLPENLVVAGKTGTTNDQRDSWFSGFSDEYVGVVWLGRDDNGKMPLTGASGSLQIWADIMAGLGTRSMAFQKPQGVTYHWVEAATGLLSSEGCAGARYLPFIDGSEPTQKSNCYRTTGGDVMDWIKGRLGL